MHVVAKDNEGKEIDFFVFDLKGTLVQNYKMKAGDHQEYNRACKRKLCVPCFLR